MEYHAGFLFFEIPLEKSHLKRIVSETSLVVQWLRLRAFLQGVWVTISLTAFQHLKTFLVRQTLMLTNASFLYSPLKSVTVWKMCIILNHYFPNDQNHVKNLAWLTHSKNKVNQWIF